MRIYLHMSLKQATPPAYAHAEKTLDLKAPLTPGMIVQDAAFKDSKPIKQVVYHVSDDSFEIDMGQIEPHEYDDYLKAYRLHGWTVEEVGKS